MRLRRPTSFVLAITAIVATVGFLGALTYYGAQEFSGRAADARAANEAMSFAAHSSQLATGDAFEGYIQILRYADDPILNAKSSTTSERADALQRLLYVNVNRFNSLTVADRSGLILASTDATLTSVRGSTAFSDTRANLGPANSDIILPEAGRPGYVEYSAPLRDPDGTVWAVLLGRADPATLWKGTLKAAVDGGRNVIVNSEGLFSAGVPDELLGQPWHGRPLDNGGVRADIAGTDSICGLAPIGKDTQIDRGLNVASCLPQSLIQVERHAATGKQGVITIAGAVLAVVVASLLLRLFWSGTAPGASAASGTAPARADATAAPAPTLLDIFAAPTLDAEASAVAQDDVAASESAVTVEERDRSEADLGADIEPPPDDEQRVSDEFDAAEAAPAAPAAPPPNVDALALIEAYERRNARLAERLRETVQAKLLLTATEAAAAFKLVEVDAETASTMHGHAMDELEQIRKRELRSIGQELYPGLVRMGLPGALRAMRKDLSSEIDIRLDIDTTTDSVGGGASRSSLSPSLRLVLYRCAIDAVRAAVAAGADACSIALRREGADLRLAISCGGLDRAIDGQLLSASVIAAEAYAGSFSTEEDDEQTTVILSVPAPAIEPGPQVAWIEAFDEAETAGPSPIQRDALEDVELGPGPRGEPEESAEEGGRGAASDVTLVPRVGLAAAIEELQAEYFGSIVVALDIGGDVDDPEGSEALSAVARDVMRDVVAKTLQALAAADARQCDVTLHRSGPQLMLTVLAEIGDATFEHAGLDGCEAALKRLGGYLSVEADGGGVAVSAEVSARAGADVLDEATTIADDDPVADAEHTADAA